MKFSDLDFYSSTEAMLLRAAISFISTNTNNDSNTVVQQLTTIAENIYGEYWGKALTTAEQKELQVNAEFKNMENELMENILKNNK